MLQILGTESTTMSTLTTSLKTGFEGLAGDMLNAIGSIAPVALPVMGGIALVGIGIKIFKKVAGK